MPDTAFSLPSLPPKTMNPITPEVIVEATRRIALELEPEEIVGQRSLSPKSQQQSSAKDLEL